MINIITNYHFWLEFYKDQILYESIYMHTDIMQQSHGQ